MPGRIGGLLLLPVLLVALGFLARVARAEDAPAERIVVIHCGSLLATPGEAPMGPATIVVRAGRIERVSEGHVDAARAAGPGAEFVDLSRMFVLPGLIDCHTHITGELSQDSRLRGVQDSDADAALNGVVYARRTLMAGFTTIRNVGSSGRAGFALRDAINAGKVPGPRILEAGHSITPTGGHGDRTHGYREDLFDMPGSMQGVADGAEECRKAVRAQVKRGADVVKLTATGGVLSATNAGTDQQFFDDELRAIVETAHQLGRKVAAHAHGTNGINAALRAGVDSIEHGSYLDEESISLFKRTGAFLVPTLLAGKTVAERAETEGYFLPAVAAKARAVGPVMQANLAKANAAGVRIAFGTDCGVGRHGENAREFELMVGAGMTAAEVIRSATVDAAELCGLAEEAGRIAPGLTADIIAVEGDPVGDVSRLLDVAFVMKGGEVVKGGGK